jgi:prepilin-type N-terminal cleavage/methylation domain-containing protein
VFFIHGCILRNAGSLKVITGLLLAITKRYYWHNRLQTHSINPVIAPNRRRTGGFTLVEMTMVLVVMGIFMTLGLAAFSAQMNSAAATATRKKQEIIQEALIGYLRDYKRLPCPETTAMGGGQPTGLEGRQSNISAGVPDPASLCSSYWGTVPFATLGLSKDIAMDGYDNFYSYFVSNASATTNPDWTLTQNTTTNTPGFFVGIPGKIAVAENGAAAPSDQAKWAVVVLVSHGKNGEGAFASKGTRNVLPSGVAESTNSLAIPSLPATPSASPALTVTKQDFSDLFDDVVLVLRPNDLLNPLIKDGSLKSNAGKIQGDLVVARDFAIAQFLSSIPSGPTAKSACVPAASIYVADLPIDLWGTPINYERKSITPLSTVAASPTNLNEVALHIWSSGPDRASNTADDVFLPTGKGLTYAHIRTLISFNPCP